ncbi:MAG: ExbD/TolR family protein [Thermoanaerobaculaceae bacterium]
MKLERRKVPPEIFTGSMADVTFLLIIYFMVTMAFSATKGLDFAVPKEDTRQVQLEREEAVEVKVTPQGTYVVDGRALPLSQFADYLRGKIVPGKLVEGKPVIEKPVILRPDPQAPYGAMMDAFDELRQIKDKLGLSKDLNISIPTQREIENLWGALGAL